MSLLLHLQQQLSTLSRYHSSPSKIVVAYSAGIDSHVLLHALWQLRERHEFQLSAIYIHHGLSVSASIWQQHCADVCADLDVDFQTAKVTVDLSTGKGLEAQARQVRYAKLVELAPHGSVIMLAQHQDDQLETVLLQLKRGAGPKGLSGMAEYFSRTKTASSQQQVHFFRPLLDITQAQIHAYAQEHQLRWHEDDSNQNTDFERNFIRHNISPMLMQRWPHFAKSVSRSARLCAQQQLLLDETTREKLDNLRTQKDILSINGLLALSEPWRIQVVRLWLDERNIISPSQAILTQLSSQLLTAADDANPIIRWQNWQFRRFENGLYVIPLTKEIIPYIGSLTLSSPIELPNKFGILSLCTNEVSHKQSNVLPVENIEQYPISVEFGGFSRRFTPQDAHHSKPLKQWFKHWRIPPWERSSVVIICQQSNVVGLLIKGVFYPSKSTRVGHTQKCAKSVTPYFIKYQSNLE
ncbi:tRNA lysidine(34) synthetase TilS [Paraglaciecola sp. 20A4]|uniref:tRNA lysidine(34) synthetase TilS n=1 Tax=Paraglaciecola sp. 20A4 TaxID=2687288 RepID=UPI00140C8657|nr:tRNA lysidine(34) synthetase TilS [Paraglaciecola sp. 20A4]